jgi:energy-coupling factor transport system substrate-specific component
MRTPRSEKTWHTPDIVVVAVLAVAFGVIFWVMAGLWSVAEATFAFFPPGKAAIYGVWLLPAVLGGLIVRKPGAAVATEFLAALISALLGNQWGTTVLLQGFLEGLGAEVIFLAFGYRSFRLPVAMLAAAGAGIAATLFDVAVWYKDLAWWSFKLPYIVIGSLSSLIIAGIGGHLLTRALARTGVLDRFASGRDRELV